MRRIEFIIFLLFFLFIFKGNVFSVTTSIIEYPSTLSADAFNIKVLVEGASAGQNYLRVDLYKEGSTNYFGETFNNTDWYFGSDGKKYLPITIESGKVASVSVQARVGQIEGTDYSGPGEYKMKIRRYTSSGTQASDTQSVVTVSINLFTPTPSPTLTPTPQPQSSSTFSPSPTKTPSPSSSSTPSITQEQSPTIDESQDVLGETTTKADRQVDVKTKGVSAKNNVLAFVFIVLGFVFMIACVIFSFLSFKKYKKEGNLS